MDIQTLARAVECRGLCSLRLLPFLTKSCICFVWTTCWEVVRASRAMISIAIEICKDDVYNVISLSSCLLAVLPQYIHKSTVQALAVSLIIQPISIHMSLAASVRHHITPMELSMALTICGNGETGVYECRSWICTI